MFCFQCEQAAKGTGCTVVGVCGKTPETAALQDLLVYSAKGLSQWATRARALGVSDHAWDIAVVEALFTTVTNVNFDPESVAKMIWQVVDLRDAAKAAYLGACEAQGKTAELPTGPATYTVERELRALQAQAAVASIETRMDDLGEDIVGLQEMLTYGLKGMAAYADHALILGQEDDAVYAYIHEALDFLCDAEPTVEALLAQNLKCGEVNLRVLELLDAANTGAYGHPVPTSVRTTPVAGKCILVSGHDLKDLEELLKHAVVGEAPEASGVVEIGTVITAEIWGDEERFLLGSREMADGSDLDVYSAKSPLGAAILGLKVGDTSSYAAPNGNQIEVKILAVDTYAG